MKKLIKKILKFFGIEELHYICQQEFEITCRSFFPECPFIRGVDGNGEEYSTLMIEDGSMFSAISWSPSGIEFKDWESGYKFSIDSAEELINALKMIYSWNPEFISFEEIESEDIPTVEIHFPLSTATKWEGFHPLEEENASN